MSTFEVRAICEDDLEHIEKHFYDFPKHLSRYKSQKNNEAVYLIGWKDLVPVAHALVKWKGTKRDSVAALLNQCPEIEGMRVMDGYRGQGFGRCMMQKAIALVKQKGYSKLGLQVRPDNVPAISLYTSLGFKDLGIGEYVLSWPYTDKDGVRHIHEETCIYMVKNL